MTTEPRGHAKTPEVPTTSKKRTIRRDSLPPAQRAASYFCEAADNILGRIDYRWFLSEIIGYGRNPHFWQFHDPTLQRHLAKRGQIFQDWLRTRHKQTMFRKVLEVRPRGTGKSSTGTQTLPIFAHMSNSEIAVGVMSAQFADMGVKFVKQTRSLLDGNDYYSRLTELYGEMKPEGREREWSTGKITTTKRRSKRADPTISAFSVGKGATSGHFDLFIPDDLIREEDMVNDQEWLNKVWDAYSRLSFVLNRDGLLYILCTRYHTFDLVGRIVREEIEPAVRERTQIGAPPGTLPSDFDYQRGWIKYAHLAGWEVLYDSVYVDDDLERKEPQYPVIWSPEMIEHARRKGAKGERDFWTQLMNNPALREDKPVNEQHVARARGTPEWYNLGDAPQVSYLDFFCDFAFKDAEAYQKQRGDYTVLHVTANDRGFVWRLHGWRGRPTQDMFGDVLIRMAYWAKTARGARVRYVVFDKPPGHGGGDSSTVRWLQGLWNQHPDLNMPMFVELTHRKNKAQRILDTAWAWQEGWVRLCREAPGIDPLIDQYLNIGDTEFDDDADAFANAFNEKFYQASPKQVGLVQEDSFNWVPAVGGEFDDQDMDDLDSYRVGF